MPLKGLSQDNKGKCNDCFNTEIVELIEEDLCLHIELKVSAQQCGQALSHLTVEAPCGTVAEATNSENWAMSLNSADPTTGIYGLKVDDIPNFGEDGKADSFILNYTICSDDKDCMEEIKNNYFTVAYKTGTCIFTDSILIDSQALDATIEVHPITCYGEDNGSIDVSVRGGIPPYSFLWNNGFTTEDIANLPAGEYEVYISDANGENLTLSAALTEPESIKVNSTITNSNCGFSDGAIHIEVTGGLPPYKYSWNTGHTTATVDKLKGGLYTVTVEDALACAKSYAFRVKEESDLSINIDNAVLECHEEGQGTLTATVSGGLAPYTYLWNNGDTTATANDLSSGGHTITVTDANGCAQSERAYVTLKKLNITAAVNNPLCHGDSTGSISIEINNGTPPYDIQWITGDTTSTVTNLPPNYYPVTVTDSVGCSNKKYIRISEPEAITLNAAVRRQSCESEDSTMLIIINANGGTPPYDIYYKGELLPDDQLTTDKEGDYEFTVIDANECSITQNVTIERPDAVLKANIDIVQPNCEQPYGSVTITPSEGNEPYVAIWSDGYTGLVRNNLEPGEYTVSIEDAIACNLTQTVQIDSVRQASVKITPPINAPLCNSTDNVLQAITEHAESYQWTIQTANNWLVQNQTDNQLLYSSGEGNASISLEVTSIDGCTASDTIILSCTNEDSSGEDGTEGETPDTSTCENNCLDIIGINMELTNDDCYVYTAEVITNGNCQYDLSHLTISIDEGFVSEVSNSQNWPEELNSSDPTTGLYGFKIDNIEGFGKYPESFSLQFKLCTQAKPAPQSFLVAYKAAQCIMFDTLNINVQPKLASKSYPNPFVEQTTIEFTPAEDDYAVLNIYGANGKLLQCLYEGPVSAQTKYTFKFRSPVAGSNIYFYQLKCGKQSASGKLIQTAY